MKLCTKDKFKALSAERSGNKSFIRAQTITRKHFFRLSRKRNCKAARVLVRPSKHECSYQIERPREPKSLSGYSSNVFPEGLPSKLPPNREIERP